MAVDGPRACFQVISGVTSEGPAGVWRGSVLIGVTLDEGIEHQTVDQPAPADSVRFQAPRGQFLVQAGPAEAGIVRGGFGAEPAGLEILGDGRLGVGHGVGFFDIQHNGPIIPNGPVTQPGPGGARKSRKSEAFGFFGTQKEAISGLRHAEPPSKLAYVTQPIPKTG